MQCPDFALLQAYFVIATAVIVGASALAAYLVCSFMSDDDR